MSTPLEKYLSALESDMTTEKIEELVDQHFPPFEASEAPARRRRAGTPSRRRPRQNDSAIIRNVPDPNLRADVQRFMAEYNIDWRRLMVLIGVYLTLRNGAVLRIVREQGLVPHQILTLMLVAIAVWIAQRDIASVNIRRIRVRARTPPRSPMLQAPRVNPMQNREQTREEFINAHISIHVRRKEEIVGLPIYEHDEDMRLVDTGEVVPNDVPAILTQVSTNSGSLSSRLQQTEPQYRALHIGPIDGGTSYVDKVPFLKTDANGQPIETMGMICLRCMAIKKSDGKRCVNIIDASRASQGKLTCATHDNAVNRGFDMSEKWAVDEVAAAPIVTPPSNSTEKEKNNLRF